MCGVSLDKGELNELWQVRGISNQVDLDLVNVGADDCGD